MSDKAEPGTLFVVATPIGNLEDITLRALRVLKEASIIAAENVERTRRLCRHYGIKTRVFSFNQHNWKRRAPHLLELLSSGEDVALVSDAGTPGVSDPGGVLVSLAAERGIKAVPIPGPSAVSAALSVAGLPSTGFVFLGFLPVRAGARKRELERWSKEPLPLVIFEAPHRLKQTLQALAETMGSRKVVLLREMTKLFEEVKRGSAEELLQEQEQKEIKGEITLVVTGSLKGASNEVDEALSSEIQQLLIKDGKGVTEVAELLSQREGIPYRRVYKMCLETKRKVAHR